MGAWDPTHDPEARPLGCNGKYGRSGTARHMNLGTPVCGLCRASINHYQREYRRGRAVEGEGRVHWDLTHNPMVRPLGCNGRYGKSGADTHRRHGQKVCARCRKSQNHYQREVHRGGIKPRPLKPCGTNAAAERHRINGEELCFACKVAISQRVQQYRERQKVMDVHQ